MRRREEFNADEIPPEILGMLFKKAEAQDEIDPYWAGVERDLSALLWSAPLPELWRIKTAEVFTASDPEFKDKPPGWSHALFALLFFGSEEDWLTLSPLLSLINNQSEAVGSLSGEEIRLWAWDETDALDPLLPWLRLGLSRAAEIKKIQAAINRADEILIPHWIKRRQILKDKADEKDKAEVDPWLISTDTSYIAQVLSRGGDWSRLRLLPYNVFLVLSWKMDEVRGI